MNTDLTKQAVRWFVHRFIEHEAARIFVMLRNGFSDEELGVQDNTLRYRTNRYPRYDLAFTESIVKPNRWFIEPNNELSSWARGTISLEGHFIYTSGERVFSRFGDYPEPVDNIAQER